MIIYITNEFPFHTASTQWAAVATKSGLIKEPPQKWLLMIIPDLKDTAKGAKPSGATLPPMILLK